MTQTTSSVSSAMGFLSRSLGIMKGVHWDFGMNIPDHKSGAFRCFDGWLSHFRFHNRSLSPIHVRIVYDEKKTPSGLCERDDDHSKLVELHALLILLSTSSEGIIHFRSQFYDWMKLIWAAFQKFERYVAPEYYSKVRGSRDIAQVLSLEYRASNSAQNPPENPSDTRYPPQIDTLAHIRIKNNPNILKRTDGLQNRNEKSWFEKVFGSNVDFPDTSSLYSKNWEGDEQDDDEDDEEDESLDDGENDDDEDDAEENRAEFVEELMLMGFPEDWCVLALKQTENDIVNASAWIVDNLEYLMKRELNQLDLQDLVRQLREFENTLSILYARQIMSTVLHQTRHSRELSQGRLLFSQYLQGYVELLHVLQGVTGFNVAPTPAAHMVASSSGDASESEGCLLLYDRKRTRSSLLSFADDNLSVSYSGNEVWKAACAVTSFSTGVHSWLVRIEKSSSPYLFVGVATRQANLDSFLGADDQSWGFIGDKALYYQRNRIRAYGETFTEGDCIGLRLDCEKGELSFSKNGVDLGVAFDNIVGSVSPAVAFYSRHQKISFVKDSCTA
ncbi:uncharacterized protein PITG_00094 [Phytophthora infestans T30-4]|uniref:B30.2/SPRY domain-containing protein n=1 Tax=Phytophthora infestans (strain T30-4) TaxID=403677 RepID=D0MSV3_PHYIT|nr:uncharacterized protein PITG_00094 [Phytophthora infestans T30-4]EEY57537.1 conserved hypothetical protein [Phytophthora infestans T30-4]|eukprot:XP_002908723.1 conserved hypothetical protein [Phytophthora infestans T30-4]